MINCSDLFRILKRFKGVTEYYPKGEIRLQRNKNLQKIENILLVINQQLQVTHYKAATEATFVIFYLIEISHWPFIVLP